MLVFNCWQKLADYLPNIVIALGTFDGVHVGHQAVIRQAVDKARQIDGSAVVFTFSNHPLATIAPEKFPLQLLSSQEKIWILKNLAVDAVFNIPFDETMYKMTAHEFSLRLAEYFAPKAIVVGENYNFGRGARGTPFTLVESGFNVLVNAAVMFEGQVVSSTLIRQCIADGDVTKAGKLLGRPPSIRGTVRPGNRIGRTLGFPTANIAVPDDYITPGDGVYAANCLLNQRVYAAIVNVGSNPTFIGIERRIEVHILDFDADLYGRELVVLFKGFIRDERRFTGREDLRQQIVADCEQARMMLQECGREMVWLRQ